MHQQLVDRLLKRFDAYSDLAARLDADLLKQKIDVPKHKSLAEHLWCIIGARESYARAIEQGAWAGFSCSMQSFGAADFADKLRDSQLEVETALHNVADWTDERSDLLATLAEHEVMHEGQIIRHMYAINQELPSSWVWA